MLTRVTAPTVEPVTLATAKAQARITFNQEDAIITDWIQAARELAETHTARSFITTAWKLTGDNFPGRTGRGHRDTTGYPSAQHMPESPYLTTALALTVPVAPLIAVQSLTYTDPTGAVQALSPTLYNVEPGDGGRITPVYGTTWPAARSDPGSVTVNFTAGYGPTAADVPARVRQAIQLQVAYWCINRDAAGEELTGGIKRLLSSFDWGGRHG